MEYVAVSKTQTMEKDDSASILIYIVFQRQI